MPPKVIAAVLNNCKKCGKEVKVEKVFCSECKCTFHTGCANAYIKLRNADKCCAVSLGSNSKVASYVPKIRESTRRKEARSDVLSKRRSLSLPSDSEHEISALIGSLTQSAVFSQVACPQSVAASHTGSPLAMSPIQESNLPAGWDKMTSDERQTQMMLKMVNVGSEMSSLRADVSVIKSTLQSQSDKLEKLEQNNLSLTREVFDLKQLLSSAPSSELRVSGIPLDVDLNNSDVCKYFLHHLNLSSLENSILSVRDVKQKALSGSTQESHTRSIIVKFSSVQTRDHVVVTAKRMGEIVSEDVFAGTAVKSRVFVSEFLPKAVMDLYMKAKAKKNECGFKYVWVKGGRIFARREDNSEQLSIVTENDLEKMQ